MSKPKRRRSYDASGRVQRAAANQERMLEIARGLFAERGYAETTIEAIATAANVAIPTVYAAFGSKRGILTRLLESSVSGGVNAPPILETEGARAVFAEPDRQRALALFAMHMTKIQDRIGPLIEIMKHAARTDDEVAQMYARAQQQRYRNLEALAKKLAERGPLRAGLSVEDAGRTIWVLASPETRHMLRVHAGWSAAQYEAWLARTLAAALLP